MGLTDGELDTSGHFCDLVVMNQDLTQKQAISLVTGQEAAHPWVYGLFLRKYIISSRVLLQNC